MLIKPHKAMSVSVSDLKVFSAIQRKINLFQYNKQCDINYCYSLNLSEQETKDFVCNLLELNELSYIKRYREEYEPSLKDSLTFNYDKTISTLQLLKYLHCIDYNIEMHTIKNGYSGTEQNEVKPQLLEAYKLLQKAIEELQLTVISRLTKYDSLKWCDI